MLWLVKDKSWKLNSTPIFLPLTSVQFTAWFSVFISFFNPAALFSCRPYYHCFAFLWLILSLMKEVCNSKAANVSLQCLCVFSDNAMLFLKKTKSLLEHLCRWTSTVVFMCGHVLKALNSCVCFLLNWCVFASVSLMQWGVHVSKWSFKIHCYPQLFLY